MATRALSVSSFFLWVALCGAMAFGLSHLAGLSFWSSFAIAASALFLNGVVATVEDHAPRGFLNLDGTDTPRWFTLSAGLARWGGIALMVLISAFFIVILSERPLTLESGPVFAAFTASPLLLALCFFDGRRFRWAAWVAAGLFAIGIGVGVLAK